MFLDSMFIFPVEGSVLIEKPNTYFGTEIGFKVSSLPLNTMGYFARNTFVHIGKSNPFKTGGVHPIKWIEVDSTLFPNNIKSTNHNDWINSLSRGKVFKFKTDDYTYLIQTLKYSDNRPAGRHLLVFQDHTETMVFNHVYMNTESAGISPILTQYENNQWTGQVFKDKPPILYGFLDISFGCPLIDFIGGNEPSMEILCNNRH